jgi:hypothetical protein
MLPNVAYVPIEFCAFFASAHEEPALAVLIRSCGVKVSHIEMACIIVYRPISILAVLDRGRGDLYVAAVFTDFRIVLSFVFDTFTKSCRMKVSHRQCMEPS